MRSNYMNYQRQVKLGATWDRPPSLLYSIRKSRDGGSGRIVAMSGESVFETLSGHGIVPVIAIESAVVTGPNTGCTTGSDRSMLHELLASYSRRMRTIRARSRPSNSIPIARPSGATGPADPQQPSCVAGGQPSGDPSPSESIAQPLESMLVAHALS